MAHAALVGWHIGLQLVFPAPEQLEAPAVPDHGVEGREEAQPVVDLVPDRPGVLALRPGAALHSSAVCTHRPGWPQEAARRVAPGYPANGRRARVAPRDYRGAAGARSSGTPGCRPRAAPRAAARDNAAPPADDC